MTLLIFLYGSKLIQSDEEKMLAVEKLTLFMLERIFEDK